MVEAEVGGAESEAGWRWEARCTRQPQALHLDKAASTTISVHQGSGAGQGSPQRRMLRRGAGGGAKGGAEAGRVEGMGVAGGELPDEAALRAIAERASTWKRPQHPPFRTTAFLQRFQPAETHVLDTRYPAFY